MPNETPSKKPSESRSNRFTSTRALGPHGTPMNAINPNQYAANDLLTDKQVGDWMNCSARSARNWLARHKVKPADVPGRTKWYRAGDIRTNLESSLSAGEAP